MKEPREGTSGRNLGKEPREGTSMMEYLKTRRSQQQVKFENETETVAERQFEAEELDCKLENETETVAERQFEDEELD